MALRSILGTNTIEEWKDKYNLLASDAGDLALLTTVAQNSLVAAANELESNHNALDTRVGALASINVAIRGASVTTSLEALYVSYAAYVIATNNRLNTAESNIVTLQTAVGTLASLTTTAKTNLVVAINEVDADLAALDTRVGALTSINAAIRGASVSVSVNNFYTAYSSFVSTTNSSISTINTNIGTLGSLTTTAKSSLVASINEVDSDLAALSVLHTNLDTRVGALASINATIRGASVAVSLDSFYTAYSSYVSTTNGRLNTAESNISALQSWTGSLSGLHAAIQAAVNGPTYADSLIGAINFVYSVNTGETATFTNASVSGVLTVSGAASVGGGLSVSGGDFTSRGILDQATANRLQLTNSLIDLKTNTAVTGTLTATGLITGSGFRGTATTVSLTNSDSSSALILTPTGTNIQQAGVTYIAMTGSAISLTRPTSITGTLAVSGALTRNGATVWDSSNDGPGSTLDADLLDGQDGSFYTNIVARLGYTPLNSTSYTAADVLSKLLTVDGTGSGLDADALDGQDSTFYTNIPARLGYTPLNSASYTAADVLAKLLTVDGTGTGLDADVLDGQDSSFYTNIPARLGYTPFNSAGGTIGGNVTIVNDLTVYRTASPNTGVLFLNSAQNRYLHFDGANYTLVSTNLYVNGGLAWTSTNDGPGSGLDADLLDSQDSSFYTNIPARLGYTPLNSASYTAADVLSKILTVDGPGSGLDADLLDGLTSSQFVRKDSTTTLDSGVSLITISSNSTAISGLAGNAAGALEVRGNGTGPATISFHRPASYAINFGLDNDNVLRIGGWSLSGTSHVIWHAGNDGAGSGLDADSLDGQDGSFYTNIPARLGYTPLNSASYTAADVMSKVQSLHGPGSGLNADLLDSMNASTSAAGNTIVARDGSGYVYGSYINMTDDSGSSGVTGVIVKRSDNFYRTSTAAGIIGFLLGADGAGSGLDADVLDGQDSSFYTNIPARLGYTPVERGTGVGQGANAIKIGWDGASRVKITVDVTDQGSIWTSGYDGAGSGLDADLLDGQDGSFYTNIPARLGYTPFNSAGGSLGGSLAVTGTITSTGDITAFSSDVNLKTNFARVNNTWEILGGIEGWYFDWNDVAKARTPSIDNGARRIGLKAQEIEAVLPEAMGEEIDGYKTVRYDALVPVLIEAVKDLKAEIEALKAQLRNN